MTRIQNVHFDATNISDLGVHTTVGHIDTGTADLVARAMTQYSSNDAPSKWFVDDVTGNSSRSTMSADNCVSNHIDPSTIIEIADWESEVNIPNGSNVLADHLIPEQDVNVETAVIPQTGTAV